MSLNSPHIGHENKEPIDNLVISEEHNVRNNIHFSEIETMGRNLITDLTIKKISKKYLVRRNGPLYVDNETDGRHLPTNIDHSLPSKYPNSLFSKGVKVLNEDFVGFIMKETNDKIVIFGNYVQRYDIPKSRTYEAGGHIILNMDVNEFVTYEVDNYTSLPK